MPPLSRRALLATVAAGSAGSVAGCNAIPRDSPSTPTQSNGFGGNPVYLADGVTLPKGIDPVTVEDPAGGRIALFSPNLSGTAAPLRALRGGTPIAVVGRDAQKPLMDICAAGDWSYGFASDSWGPETRVAAAVPYGESLVTHLFEGRELPRELPQVIDSILNTPRYGCTLDADLPTLPDGFNDRAKTLGSSFIHGRNDVAGFLRQDTVRETPDGDPSTIVLQISGTIYGGSKISGDNRYTADQVRLVASFDDHLRATAPPDVETDDLEVRRDVDPAGEAVEHRFTPVSDETRQRFSACQHSLVTTSRMRDRFSYTANGRFRWHNRRFIREDDLWHHHTPGQAAWYLHGDQ